MGRGSESLLHRKFVRLHAEGFVEADGGAVFCPDIQRDVVESGLACIRFHIFIKCCPYMASSCGVVDTQVVDI